MPEIMYSSIDFGNVSGLNHVSEDSMKNARKFLEKINGAEYHEIDRHYHLGDIKVIDMNGLGLRIQYEKEEELKSLVEKLFS